jgi:hypothetical protein
VLSHRSPHVVLRRSFLVKDGSEVPIGVTGKLIAASLRWGSLLLAWRGGCVSQNGGVKCAIFRDRMSDGRSKFELGEEETTSSQEGVHLIISCRNRTDEESLYSSFWLFMSIIRSIFLEFYQIGYQEVAPLDDSLNDWCTIGNVVTQIQTRNRYVTSVRRNVQVEVDRLCPDLLFQNLVPIIDESRLVLLTTLGQGAFGRVMKAYELPPGELESSESSEEDIFSQSSDRFEDKRENALAVVEEHDYPWIKAERIVKHRSGLMDALQEHRFFSKILPEKGKSEADGDTDNTEDMIEDKESEEEIAGDFDVSAEKEKEYLKEKDREEESDRARFVQIDKAECPVDTEVNDVDTNSLATSTSEVVVRKLEKKRDLVAVKLFEVKLERIAEKENKEESVDEQSDLEFLDAPEMSKSQQTAYKIFRSMHREVFLMSVLRHPNIVNLRGVCLRTDTPPWLIMELVGGGDLFGNLMDPGESKGEMFVKMIVFLILNYLRFSVS